MNASSFPCFVRVIALRVLVIFAVTLAMQVRADVLADIKAECLSLGATQYQIAFVTAGTTTVGSADISYYNAFVSAQATGAYATGTLSTIAPEGSTTWKAIVSTPTSNARENAPSYANVPIFNTAGELVASGSSQLWSGTEILNPIKYDQDGASIYGRLSWWVWTGTDSYGLAVPGYALGEITLSPGSATGPYLAAWDPQASDLSLYSAPWISESYIYGYASAVQEASGPIYALSSPIAIPEPAPLFLLAVGAMALLGRRVV